MMQRVEAETIARILGPGWEKFIEPANLEPETPERAVDSEPESRNNNT
ncbi:MAG: hypothetical protein SFV18_09690 [Bryobacteraceae bacterium]|nr:hypothetical protein [Bryobacteraceae bacterium]